VLHPKYYGSDIRTWTEQEGIGNLSHNLRMAYHDWATDTVGAQLGSTDSAAPENPWANYWYQPGKLKCCHGERQPWWSSSAGQAIGRKTGMQGAPSLDRGIGAGLFPVARHRGTTPRVGNRCIVTDGSKARGDTIAPHGQETRGIMLPLTSSSLTPDYGDELGASPVLDSMSVSPTYPRCLQRL